MVVFSTWFLLWVWLKDECSSCFCFGMAPAYDIFRVVSSGGVVVSIIQEFQSIKNPRDEGLKYLKIEQIILQMRATRKVYPILSTVRLCCAF